ncbi:MAG: V-type ATP synthase subunit F [Caloramator sp.]|nr:V-type ATP synthase subunit F [Caloramator sp.]
MNIYLISDNRDTLVGMRLAGIKGTITNNKKEAEKLFDSLIKNKDIMIIIITEKLAESMRDKINNIKQKMKLPLIVEIPDRHGSIKDEDYITGYVRDSIGIKI